MDDFYSINVNQIQKNKHERNRYKYTTYKKILEKCYLKIKTCSDNNQDYCIYTIPDFIIGEPLFRKNFCANFILEHLKQNGFKSSFILPTYVFISWDFGNDKKFEGFRRTNTSFTKPKKMIDFRRVDDLNKNKIYKKYSSKNDKSKNQITNFPNTINTNDDMEKFRIINDYVPLKSMLFKKKS